MKKESGLSNVVGVVLLLFLVIVTASVLGLILSSATYDAVDSTPNVIFTTSKDPYMLYNGGGDILYKNRLVFYSNGVDITDDISINSTNTWTEWHTGQAIELPAGYYVANLMIIALDSLGREQLLFQGSGVVMTPLPTTTITPTITSTVTPTPTPTVTITPTPIPTPSPYYNVGNDNGTGYATVEEFVDSLNNWSNALYGEDVAILYGGNHHKPDYEIAFFGDIPIGHEPINITGEMVADLPGHTLIFNTYGGSLTEVQFTRAPGYEGELLVISSDAELETTGATLKLDGMGHGDAPLLVITSGGSLNVHQDLTLTNNTNPTGNGGAVFNEGDLYVSRQLIIYNNTANNGGGIYNLGEITLKSANVIKDNVALEKGGGIYNAGNAGSSKVPIQGPITNNSAKYGGGVYNDGTMTTAGSISGNTASISGGGVYNTNTGTYKFSGDSTVSGNQAQYGGGIYNDGSISSLGKSISDNTVAFDGGGVYNTGTITSSSTPVSGNRATRNGGGIYIYDTGVMTFNGDLISNTADQNGGGLYNAGSYTMNWGSFTENTAGGIGNQVYATGTSSNSIPTWLIILINGGGYYYAN